MSGPINEDGWLNTICLYAQIRMGEKTMTEYEVKLYESACEMMEQQARFHKLFLELSIKRAKEEVDDE